MAVRCVDERAGERCAFATRALGRAPDTIERASEDASFRSYWRVRLGAESRILMDAPPTREDCGPFVAIAQRLRAAGLHPPRIDAMDLERGFLLLEDLGDTLFADLLDEQSVEALYGQAFSVLERLAALDTGGLPAFDAGALRAELALFPEWYVAGQLGRPLDRAFTRWWEPVTDALVAAALSQPRVFVHRDFHCGNLMPAEHQPAVLDFQDAVAGPITYDLVSLLYDRYASWPRERVLAWSEAHRRRVLPEAASAQWRRWVDLMALQRNLKIVGIFARLDRRDGKPRYLRWQPRFLGYLRETAARHPAFEPLAAFLAEAAP